MQTQENARTILIGEGDLEVRHHLEVSLKCMGYAVKFAEDGEDVLACLASSQAPISAVLLDLVMPCSDGMETLLEIRKHDPCLPVIILSGIAPAAQIVSAMKCGATDFLSKPVDSEDLLHSIDKALQHASSESAPQFFTSPKTKAFLGQGVRMQALQALVTEVGWSDAPVLIQGETGTGKEVLARELHAHSPRAGKVFRKLNCAALPSELVESELFGYERGAFTGAFQRKPGMFEAADGGTLLLDEIGDMDVRLQAKLLQVLQDREFQRLGGRDLIHVDVRVISATHRDLEAAIQQQSFREDLYYRLNVINLELPPLRERPEDVIPLAEYLLRRHATRGREVPRITAELKEALLAHSWPGNVRELENVVRKLIVLGDAGLVVRDLRAKGLRKPIRGVWSNRLVGGSVASGSSMASGRSMPTLEQVSRAKEAAEARAIEVALSATRWNRKQAAALLKIDYKALLYKMKKLGIEADGEHFPSPAEPAPRVRAAGQGA